MAQRNYTALLGKTVSDVRPLARGTSGSGAMLSLLTLDDGTRLVAKEGADSLLLEAWMLHYLRERSDFPVPSVWHEAEDLIVMDYLPGEGASSSHTQEQIADAVAGLHRITGEAYGLERETIIGALPQPNPPETDWRVFFAEHRLLHMGRKAVAEGRLDRGTLNALDNVCGRLDDLIPDPAPPTLIHGDLWGGNVLVGENGLSGFIDPAIYYADPEIELAFMTLFGTVGDRFFARYGEHHVLRPGFFEVRRDLYNLYPLLVHVRLFGGGYAGQVASILKRLTG